ncbi:hypothetical protein T11_13350, partial [Trichinella zimbabwensis]
LRKSPSEHPKCEKRLFRKFLRKSPSEQPNRAQFTLKSAKFLRKSPSEHPKCVKRLFRKFS